MTPNKKLIGLDMIKLKDTTEPSASLIQNSNVKSFHGGQRTV